MTGLKAEITLSDYITFKGQRYEVRIEPIMRDPCSLNIVSVEKQIVLIPVEPNKNQTENHEPRNR